MVLVLVARVRGLEGVGADVDAQHRVDDIPQGGVVDAGALVDAVAGVEADHLGRNAAQGVVQRCDVGLGELAPFGRAQALLAEEAGQRRVVHLEDDAGIDDGPVLLPHRLGDGEHELLVRLVVLVATLSLDVVD